MDFGVCFVLFKVNDESGLKFKIKFVSIFKILNEMRVCFRSFVKEIDFWVIVSSLK